MHELSITQTIVSLVTENAQGGRVKHVTIEIGKLSAVSPEAIRFCFDIVSQGTVVEGAHLEIHEISGTAECRACGMTFDIEQLYGQCACGSEDLILLTGQELMVKQMVTV